METYQELLEEYKTKVKELQELRKLEDEKKREIYKIKQKIQGVKQ